MEASKKFTPDQQLIFDAESSDIRWFLLPSEAKQYIFDENTGMKKTVFTVRNSLKNSHSDFVNGNTFLHTDMLNPMQDVNCNFAESENIISVEGIIPVGKTTTFGCCERTCPLKKENISILPESALSSVQLCRWYSPPSIIFKPFLKAVSQFEMIKNGDKVLVCVSGGKDSLSLLHTLHQYQFYAKNQGLCFEIGAMTVDPKSPLYDPSPLKAYLKALNVPYFYEEQDIVSQAAKLDKCTSICSFCSRLKRGRIYACAHRQNYNVIALGQHLDDLAESFLMSVFHNGRLRTMKAHYTDKSSSLRIIRPFVFVREKDLRTFAAQMLQDYDTSFSRVYFSPPRLFFVTLSLLPVPTFFSSLVARSFSLSRLSFDLLPGAGSGSLHAPPKSKICPLWLILPFQTSGTENSQTVKQKIHEQNTIISTVKSLDDCSSESSLIQTHEIILIVHPIEISDYVPRKI
ncbi:tRNA-cytidine(32) 2-sulfurtransferase [Trichonephila clavipes]|nr:tRNA-cytidine(32) 2-sulfurtransferase [Trichonephila clavipes]